MSSKRDNSFLQSADHISNTTWYLVRPVCSESSHIHIHHNPKVLSPGGQSVLVRGAEGLRVVPRVKDWGSPDYSRRLLFLLQNLLPYRYILMFPVHELDDPEHA